MTYYARRPRIEFNRDITFFRDKKSSKIPKGYNQNPYIEEQTTQWPKENKQKDKQRSTKHTYKTKDRVTRTSLKTGREIRWSGRVGSSYSTRDTRRINLVTNPVISHERGKDREVFATSGTYLWSYALLVQYCDFVLDI